MLFYLETLDRAFPTRLVGSVLETTGGTASVADFPAPVGAVVHIERSSGGHVPAEVIGFRNNRTLVFPFESLAGVRRGAQVQLVSTMRQIRIGDELLGRVINAHGTCVDGRPQPMLFNRTLVDRDPPMPSQRPRIDQPLSTGIRSVDSMLTCGQGQRLGIFAGPGVGKSVLLGMISKFSSADVNVIALVGERGRELNDFIQRDLGPEGLKRSIIVCATSNEPAVSRVQAALTATAIAEHYRDRGKNVLLLVDSVTRFATALREIGLASGEPPATRGFPPSVFATLPKLVERAGRNQHGSITAFYSVLVEGDDPSDPVADTMQGLLDGHLWLSRDLASSGHYPAIDILKSISRLMPDIVPANSLAAARNIRKLMAVYHENEDLISVGAYRRGSNKLIDAAIDMREAIAHMLQQQPTEHCSMENSTQQLLELGARCGGITVPPAEAAAEKQLAAAT
ncbi:FliI/YscN family ATPase [Aeoliella mucimassa]|uniref:Flagellum-specific ATP synthase n=1 Tax=Aeoliella mucimassa TaxID=2527972 RepID=A0A518AKQ4_9BACT|nr:FliI/YscN family ATPase [Aeoliella mucimassa]QDU55318.1 Flagellum-specific ATP synthase [Aeoliella mucimassa]